MAGKVIAVSGGFDPVTPGHIEYFSLASLYGEVVAIINTDEFLMKKKGFVFMPFRDRVIIVSSIKYITAVMESIDKDQTVAESLRYLKPDFFAKGGDRTLKNLPQEEIDACHEIGCQIICGLGEKTHSSSWYINAK